MSAFWEIQGSSIGTGGCSVDFALNHWDGDYSDTWAECGQPTVFFLAAGSYTFVLGYEHYSEARTGSTNGRCGVQEFGGFGDSASDVFKVKLQLSCSDSSPCVGDFDGDDDVDLSDLTSFLAAFGASGCDAAYNPLADFNNDGQITLADYTEFLTHYGSSCS